MAEGVHKHGGRGSGIFRVLRSVLLALIMAPVFCSVSLAAVSQGKARQIRMAEKAPTGQSYYTRTELEALYRKKYASKIPYDFHFGKITGVSFSDEGVVFVTAVASPVYSEMPLFARSVLYDRSWNRIMTVYCRKIAANKAPYSRVRRVEGDMYDGSGRSLHHVTLYPGICGR